MIINSSDFRKIHNLVNATLAESTDGASVLTLEFNGFADDIDAAELEMMAPWAIIHAGKLLFSGRVTDISRTNSAGAKSTSVTISNAMWLLDHVPYGAQLEEIRAAAMQDVIQDAMVGGYPCIVEAAEESFATWQSAAAGCEIDAPLWLADEAGNPRQDGKIGLDVTRANPALYTKYKPDGIITAWTALLAMREANPDAVFRFNYASGKIEVISLDNASSITYDTGAIDIPEISDISPQYENRCDGVACLVTWYWPEMYGILGGTRDPNYKQELTRTERIMRPLWSAIFPKDEYIEQLESHGFNVKDLGEYAGSLSFTYPAEGVEMGASMVQIVNATCYTRTQAEEQAAFIRSQVESYYNACNVANFAGSLSVLMEDITESPLARRMNLTGEGTHESWHNMRAVVSSVDWDFLAARVNISLGYTPPGGNFKTIEFESPVLPEMWENESETDDEYKLRSGSFGSLQSNNKTKETDHWTYSRDTGDTDSTSESYSHNSNGGGCDCAGRWAEYEIWREKIDKQIEEILEKLKEKCDCAERLFAMIEAAIKAQVNAIAFESIVETPLNENDNGTVISTSTFNIRANNGSAQVKYGYK